MKRVSVIIMSLVSFLWSYSQKIQVIVPKQVAAGNAFQIQYVIADPSELANISTPQFENLQLISGPNYYKGNSLVNGKSQSIENITYTLVSPKEGMVKIKPIYARFKNGNEEQSDEVMIMVVPEPKASFNTSSTYTDINLYAPSSKTDLEKLIDANLFIKAEVDKKICFIGEAITATFKLYSRLQSTSEVINEPSLYGFSVMDLLDINEAHQAIETINGKVFNTTVLRKLQLYPSQSGNLTVDPIQLQNSIEFVDSATGKKIKIARSLASKPIDIVVKSFPSNEPDSFSGAVGKFTITAGVPATTIEANTQGRLVITIKGKGNFIQFGAPNVQWPKGFDVFEPVIKDELNKNIVPPEGSRQYVFNFTTDQIGSFVIQPVSFNYFDLTEKKFKNVSTDSLKLEIVAPSTNSKREIQKHFQSVKKYWTYFVMAAIVCAIVLFFVWANRKKQKQEKAQAIDKPDFNQRLNDINLQHLPVKEFSYQIQKLLIDVKREHSLSYQQEQRLQNIYDDCQLLAYSNIDAEYKREELVKAVREFLKELFG